MSDQPSSTPDAKRDDAEVVQSAADRLRGDFGAFIYQEVADLTDQLFVVEGNLAVTHQKVVTLDSMNFGENVAFPDGKRPLFAARMLKLKNDYADTLVMIQKAAGVGVKYTQDYIRIVLPRMIKSSVTLKDKVQALKYMVDRKIDGEDDALKIPQRFETSIEELRKLSKEAKSLCDLVGLQLTKQADTLVKEIAATEEKIAGWKAKAAKIDPSILQVIDDSFKALKDGVKDGSGKVKEGKNETVTDTKTVDRFFVLNRPGQGGGNAGGGGSPALPAPGGAIAPAGGSSGGDSGRIADGRATETTTNTKSTVSPPSISGAVASAAPLAVLQIFYAEWQYGKQLIELNEALQGIADEQRTLDNKRLELKQLVAKQPEVAGCANVMEESVKLLERLGTRLQRSLTVFKDVKIDAANLRELLQDDTIPKEALRRSIDNAQAWNIRLLDTLEVLAKTQKARDPSRETAADRMKRAREIAQKSLDAFADYFVLSIGDLQGFFSQGQTKKYHNNTIGQRPARRPDLGVFYDLVQGASLLTSLDQSFVDLGQEIALDVLGLGLPKSFVFMKDKEQGGLQATLFAQSSSSDWLWKFTQTYRNDFEALAYHQSALGASWWETLPDLSGTISSLSAAGRFSFRLFAFILGQSALASMNGKSELDKIFEKEFGPLPDAPTTDANASSAGKSAPKPEDLDEKYATVPAAANKLTSQLAAITDNVEAMITAEIGKVFPNGNPNETTLATDFTAFVKAPASTVWIAMKDAATRLNFNGFKHLYVLNMIQLVLLCPGTQIVLESQKEATAIVEALKNTLTECQEPLYDVATGSTHVNSVYEFAARCPKVPVPLMAYCIQLALFEKLNAKANTK